MHFVLVCNVHCEMCSDEYTCKALNVLHVFDIHLDASIFGASPSSETYQNKKEESIEMYMCGFYYHILHTHISCYSEIMLNYLKSL